jgi:type IV pilus assembly protein PilB
VSKGRSTIKRFPGDKLPEIIDKHPDVAKHLFGTVVSRLNRADKMIVKLAARFSKKKATTRN